MPGTAQTWKFVCLFLFFPWKITVICSKPTSLLFLFLFFFKLQNFSVHWTMKIRDVYYLARQYKYYFSLQKRQQMLLLSGACFHILMYISRTFLYLSVLSVRFWTLSCSAYTRLWSFIQYSIVFLCCFFFTHTELCTQWFWQTINRHLKAANLACCLSLHISSVLVDSFSGYV